MASIEYHLYRIKFIKPSQLSLFNEDISPSDLFLKALQEKPSLELRRNNVWHIGNIEYFNNMTGCFAIGRTTKTTIEKYDKETGNFIVTEDDSGPYTFVLFDRAIGLLGIAKKSKVAPDVPAIARKIEKIFFSCKAVREHGVDVKVKFIPDPKSFLQKIRSAYSIKRFRAFFTGPNPVDADELFQKPLSIYCGEIGAEKGSVEVQGDGLNEETVEAVAKSTASSGNSASASIQTQKGKKPVSISLKGDAVKVSVDPKTAKESVLTEVKEAYLEVRG